jgi:divalent metal cation (Fe/Co/Zn/Cd) transporter
MSFRTAVRESNRTRGKQSWAKFIRSAKAPELPVILLEDFAALLGLVFALFGVGLTLLTGNGKWDAVGTAAIGFLLVAVAITLAIEMKSLLIGESGGVEVIRKIRGALQADTSDAVTRVIHMRTLHLGPEELLVAAKLAVGGREHGDEITAAINAAEQRAREAVPALTLVLYLEPDIDRGDAERAPWERAEGKGAETS